LYENQASVLIIFSFVIIFVLRCVQLCKNSFFNIGRNIRVRQTDGPSNSFLGVGSFLGSQKFVKKYIDLMEMTVKLSCSHETSIMNSILCLLKQSTPSYPKSLRFILILFSIYVCLSQIVSFLEVFVLKICM